MSTICAYRPFTRPILKVAFGSIWPVRRTLRQCPLFARSGPRRRQAVRTRSCWTKLLTVEWASGKLPRRQ